MSAVNRGLTRKQPGVLKENKTRHMPLVRGFRRFLDAEDINNPICHDSDPFENASAAVGKASYWMPKDRFSTCVSEPELSSSHWRVP